MSDYYDVDGNPIDLMTFAALVEMKHEVRRHMNKGETTPLQDPTRIGSDHVGDAWISTVWLGVDHGWGGGPPIIFETMIFGGNDDGFVARYCTKEQALAGHARVVEAVKYGSLIDGSIGTD